MKQTVKLWKPLREWHGYRLMLWSFVVCFMGVQSVNGQTEAPKNWQLTGYMKNLQSWLFFNDFPEDQFLQDNLLHNRLNFTWYPHENWTFRADLRTRAFFGDLVKQTPDYARLVDNVNNDYADLSLILLDRPSWVVHSMLDRLYLQYNYEDWEIRLGRQRVNWGISTVWNPNDIFNAFAFTDFDYEERPGSDALRVRKYMGFASSIELVAKADRTWKQTVIAGLWRFNQWKYDFQVLGGFVQNELAMGMGWAGNIKDAGFKGEATFFRSLEGKAQNSFAGTISVDYAFEEGTYTQLGYLYNSNGSTNQNIVGLFNFEQTAQNLYPFRHAVFAQVTYPFSPLLNGGAAIIYSPVEVHPLFINPTLTISIATNWDLDLIGQIVFNRMDEQYQSPLSVVFLRTKFSF